MMSLERARRIAADLQAEADRLKILAENCKTDGARQWFLDKAGTIARKAESIISG